MASKMSDDEEVVSSKKRKISHDDNDAEDDGANALTADGGGRPVAQQNNDSSPPESSSTEEAANNASTSSSPLPNTNTNTTSPTTNTTNTTDDDDDAPVIPPRPPNIYDNIKRAIVINDGKRENLIRLIGLKSLFARQLPKMPKEYIARLVFDRRHKSLAILSSDPSKKDCDDEIIGGICYRAYPEMRFAEIAFCAVSASQQVKGYGTKLMNLLKMHAVTEGIEYFITYADNYGKF